MTSSQRATGSAVALGRSGVDAGEPLLLTYKYRLNPTKAPDGP